MSIDVKVEARSIFRILAIRTIVENRDFAAKLTADFPTLLNEITTTDRLDSKKWDKDYLNYRNSHDGQDEGTDFENMSEERLCRANEGFFGISNNEHLGEVVDYQVPLSSSDAAGEGAIDLISKKGNEIYIIEAKSWKSSEHPIRAMFEAITFWKMIGGKNCSDFISRYNKSRKNRFKNLPDGAVAYPAILLRKESRIYDRMMKDPLEFYEKLYITIMTTCGLKCFFYIKEDDKIKIHDFTEAFKAILRIPTQLPPKST